MEMQMEIKRDFYFSLIFVVFYIKHLFELKKLYFVNGSPCNEFIWMLQELFAAA